MAKPQVEFEDVRCLRETTEAILCSIDGKEIWIPKSQVLDDSEVYKKDDEGTLIITEWIATEKGLT